MIKIEGLKVSYGDYVAVDNLNLNIQKGSFSLFRSKRSWKNNNDKGADRFIGS